MNTYKTVTLKDGSEWACNRDGEGVFSRRSDGTWLQQAGTSQTPVFKTVANFSRYIHRNYRGADGSDLPRVTASSGW